MEKKKKLSKENTNLKHFRKYNKIGFFRYYFSKIKNIFNYIYNVIKLYFSSSSLYKAQGTHIITGYPGSGKTLLMNKIINSVDENKYFFYTNIDEFNHKNVYKINLDDMFSGKKQIAKLPVKIGKKKVFGLILDEINLNFNKRSNMTRDYNDLFIGLVEFIVTHRHQRIPRIYFIGQKLELQDTQLISLFKYQHDIIRSKKRCRYWKYYKDRIQKIPIKLKVLHRIKDTNDQFIEWKKTKDKIYWYDLETYNTFALKKVYEKLPNINYCKTKGGK